jgi:hypothetical protein
VIPVDFTSNADRVRPGVDRLAGSVERVGRNADQATRSSGGLVGKMRDLGLAAIGIGGLANAFGKAYQFIDGFTRRAQDAAGALHDIGVRMRDATAAGRSAEVGRMGAAQRDIGLDVMGYEPDAVDADKVEDLRAQQFFTMNRERRAALENRLSLEQRGLGGVADAIEMGADARSAVSVAQLRRSAPEGMQTQIDEALRAVRVMGGDMGQAAQRMASFLEHRGGGSATLGHMAPDVSTLTQVGMDRELTERQVRMATSAARQAFGQASPQERTLAMREVRDAFDPQARAATSRETSARARDLADPVNAAQRAVVDELSRAAARMEAVAAAEGELTAAIRDLMGTIRGGELSTGRQARHQRHLVNVAAQGGY